jgi:hypothetical protein
MGRVGFAVAVADAHAARRAATAARAWAAPAPCASLRLAAGRPPEAPMVLAVCGGGAHGRDGRTADLARRTPLRPTAADAMTDPGYTPPTRDHQTGPDDQPLYRLQARRVEQSSRHRIT